MEGSHAIIVFINNHADVRVHLQAFMEVLYHGILALAPGVETRFVTKLLELARLLKCMDAVRALATIPELQAKYVTGNKASPESRKIFALLANSNFWKLAKESLELLQPIGDVIHHIEADKPAISQLLRVSAFMEMHVQQWWDKYRSKPVEWELGFEVPDITVFPAASAFKEAVRERQRRYYHPVFAVAHVLDPRFWTMEGSTCCPDTAFMRQDTNEFDKMRALVRRVCGGEDGGAAADIEFLKLANRGSTDAAIPALMVVEIQDGWKLTKSMDTVRLMWESVLAVEFPLLADLALRLFHLHPTSCSVERLWSVLRNVARDNRCRMGVDKTEKLVFLMAQEHLAQKEEAGAPPPEYLVESVLGF